MNRWEDIASLYHNIGNAYFNLGQYNKSIDYCIRSIQYYPQKKSQAYIGRVYATLGQNYAKLKNADSALYYYKIAAEEHVAEDNDKYAVAAIYGYMVNTYADKNDFKEMLNVSEKSLQLSRALQSNQGLASSLYNIAYAHYFNGNNSAAKEKIYEALAIAEKDSLKDELINSESWIFMLPFLKGRRFAQDT